MLSPTAVVTHHSNQAVNADSWLGTSSGTLSYACQQETHHRDLDACFAHLDFAFVLFAHPPIAREPAEGAFDDPSVRSYGESARAGCTLDDFEIPVTHCILM